MWHFKKDTLHKLTIAIYYFTIILFASCKSYHNDTIHWIDSIKIGTDISTVRTNQPDFVAIAWDTPDTIGPSIRYKVTEIKGDKDILKMTYFLVFSQDKFQGRQSKK